MSEPKNKKEGGEEKKKEKYRNAHTALTEIPSLHFWGKCHPALHMEKIQALRGGRLPTWPGNTRLLLMAA